MALCDICESVPFDDLPSLPPCYDIPELSWENIIVYHPTNDFASADRDFGYMHQSSLESLKASASTCDLCSLLLGEIGKVAKALEEASRDQDYAYYRRGRSGPDYQLRLTKRLDDGYGFLAWSATSGKEIYLLAAVGFCVNDEDPQAGFVRGRPVEDYSGSAKALGRVESWISRCDSGHTRCTVTGVPLPTRVIDVGDASNDNIRLYEPTPGTRGTYTTLSHCWGTSRPYTTTLATVASRKRSINFDELPKTFQDAVTITRYIGLKYLWLDSLCICQDDEGDWQHESGRMAAVYSNAYLSIAASHAKDDAGGCFSHAPSRTYVLLGGHRNETLSGKVLAFTLPLPKAYWMGEYVRLGDEPLVNRAWTLQERCLAPRTLHYATDQMYFECYEEFLSEDGHRYPGGFNSLDAQKPQDTVGPLGSLTQPSNTYERWYRLVQEYSIRKLSKDSDKLPALSGLARQFQLQLNDEYCAGLWRRRLVEGLRWGGIGACSRPAEYRAPSWSWAAIDGEVGVVSPGAFTCLAAIIHCQIKIRGDDPFGRIEDAQLKLRGPLEPLLLSEEPEHDWKTVPHQRYTRFYIGGGDRYGARSYFDIEEEEDGTRALPLFALVLTRETLGRLDVVMYGALIVTPVTESSKVLRRLGSIRFAQKHVQACAWATGGDATLPIVTLI